MCVLHDKYTFYADLKPLEPPEQLSLMQQLQQQVPKNMIFPKNSVQLGSAVGQGEFFKQSVGDCFFFKNKERHKSA